MSDSLRDQLLNAGFEEKLSKRGKTNIPTKPKQKKTVQINRQTESFEQQKLNQQIKRKRIKTQIKALIEQSRIKEHQGDHAYSYILGARVKQIFVTQDCHKKISNAELAITRLNGETFVIPPDVAEKIKLLNPEWAIIIANDRQSSEAEDIQYGEYKIPDDLRW